MIPIGLNKKKRKTPKEKSDDIVKSKSDDRGNLLILKNNGKRIIISLKLVSEERFRRLGVVNLARKTMEVRRTREKHLFNKFNAYGLNHRLLEDARLFDKVRLIDNYEEWLIPKEWILKNGRFLHFLSVGLERQIFINLVDMEEFKRPHKI